MHFSTFVLIPATGNITTHVYNALLPFDENLGAANPQGRWDWYVIGGRFDGYIVGTGSDNDAYVDRPDENTLLAARLVEAEHLRGHLPYALLTPHGEWFEGETVMTKPGDSRRDNATWYEQVREILNGHLDCRVVCVDAHR